MEITLSNEDKSFGVILDIKLYWDRNTLKKVVESYNKALRMQSGNLPKTKWGTKLFIVYWIYTVVVKPILFYRVTVKKTFSGAYWLQFSGWHWLKLLDLRRWLYQKSLETRLNFVALGLYGELQVTIRLDTAQLWRYRTTGQFRIMSSALLPMELDYTISYDNLFSTRILDNNEWGNANGPDLREVAMFTEGVKLNEKVRCRIHSTTLTINFNLRLSDYCSFFQAELIEITKAAEWLVRSLVKNQSIIIYSESPAVIRSSQCNYCTSKEEEALETSSQVVAKQP